MFCTHCGKKNTEQANFCFACGTALPVSDIVQAPASVMPSARLVSARAAGAPSVAFSEVNAVARLYRWLILLVGSQWVLGFLIRFLSGESDTAVLVVVALFVAVLIGLMVTSYKLTRRLGSGSPTWRALTMWIPFGNLGVLRTISNEAQTWCKRYGIDVGFFGPTKESLERLRRRDA